MAISEEFLHYLWRFRLLHPPLRSTAGEAVRILHPGEYNRDGGPDFINARIQIGSTLWAGNVEMHLLASDWFRHGHQHDPAYQNVILHVVNASDTEVLVSGDQPLPCLDIGQNYRATLAATYKALLSGKSWIPCMNLLNSETASLFRLWAPSLVIERLQSRMAVFKEWLKHAEYQWDELSHQAVSSALGSKVNAQAFEQLARSAPIRILLRHRCDRLVLEAILFGQAGLLDSSSSDGYQADLVQTYQFFKAKYSLRPLEKGIWKFLRIRPVNFPTIRISQLAGLIYTHGTLHPLLDQELSPTEWRRVLDASASQFWNNHYTFSRQSPERMKKLGSATTNLLLINGIVPLLCFLGSERQMIRCQERALSLLEEIPSEQNATVTSWINLGMPAEHALHTQALKQLKTVYCDKKRCLECRIGTRLLC